LPADSQPLAGRRLWLVGIGGAGMSGYALVADAWGAQVGGWDRNETPYLEPLRERGIEVRVSPEPEFEAGREVFVSSAYPGVEGRPRAELLAELVALRPSIVVAGAHGKTTTAAMIAFTLRDLGRDPAWIVGGEVPQLGANAGGGAGWLVAEGDESDRSVALLRPQVAVVLNVDLDHHATFASRAEVDELFEGWLTHAPHAVRGWELAPADVELAVPGEHNRRNAAAALAALELAGVERGDAARALAAFRGAGRRFELVGEAGGVQVVDDYAHNPAKLEALVGAAREARPDGRVLVLFQPHLPSRTRHLYRELGRALSHADAVCVTEMYAAREELPPDVSGRDVAQAAAEARPGMAVGWAPGLADAARIIAAWARPGDVVLTAGAGDVDRAAPLVLEALR
jgi:UDP-N-acetylmuramate--alanine ligase